MPALSMFAGWRPGRGGVLRRLPRNDRGAMATVFTILLAGGVLLGMLALTVDVGRLYAEREELQSGADAAVMAIAEKCARAQKPEDCVGTGLEAVAGRYADLNARDSASNVLEICGNVPDLSIGIRACTAPVGNLTDCIPAGYSGTRPYLEVRTGTRTPSNELLLPPSFAQTLLGNGGYEGTEVRACARATWGAPEAGLAVTFSKCEWDHAVDPDGDGIREYPDYPPYPPNTVPDPAVEVVLKLHDTEGNPDCPAGPSGYDRPGGFGWLDDKSDGELDCQTEIINLTISADPGSDVSSACLRVLDEATTGQASATVLYIPIYTLVTSQGTNTEYTIEGMAAFVPTGYFFSSSPLRKRTSWLTGMDRCSGEEKCIYGYFVNELVAVGPVSDKLKSFGATVVTLIG